MEEVRGKPKILLLKAPPDPNQDADTRAAWARLSKALKTFADLEVREFPDLAPETLNSLTAPFDFTFLDTALAPWPELQGRRHSRLALVQAASFSWNNLSTRTERMEAAATHPFLLLEDISAGDLLRLLHLFLIPKRLAGVTPMMEKGSLILGEKVMEPNSVGQLLDRVSTFCGKLEGFTLQQRLPDLRQVLSALLLEGLSYAAEKSSLYPYVDFQLSVSPQKLAVNLRFPLGALPLDSLVHGALSGSELFWHQVWQLSDATLLTHHEPQGELEVMLLLCRTDRNTHGRFRPLLQKVATGTYRKEDLLDPPHNYRFMLISEIQAQENTEMQVFSQENPEAGIEGMDMSEVPEAVTSRMHQLTEQTRVLTGHLARKNEQLEESLQKNQQLTRELNSRRGELIRAAQAKEALAESSERQIHELKASLARAKEAAGNESQARSNQNGPAMAEMLAKMESTLRAAENEKNHLRDNATHEQRRAVLLEQKYTNLYKELAGKDRELNDLRNTAAKLRKEQGHDRTAKAAASDEAKENYLPKLKELEERESFFKQEVKKLSFKVEAHEKNIRAVQNDAAEKQRLIDQKLKEAKTKEVELLKRIEELTNSLKKASKAA